jgi:osmotically-inducible protein OsmY
LRAWENGKLSETICSYDDLEPENARSNFTENRSEPTPLDQSESMADIRIVEQIRREIARAPGLSLTARNIKVVTVSGEVTLKGPVLTSGERERILLIARQTAGVGRVKDELEVK